MEPELLLEQLHESKLTRPLLDLRNLYDAEVCAEFPTHQQIAIMSKTSKRLVQLQRHELRAAAVVCAVNLDNSQGPEVRLIRRRDVANGQVRILGRSH